MFFSQGKVTIAPSRIRHPCSLVLGKPSCKKLGRCHSSPHARYKKEKHYLTLYRTKHKNNILHWLWVQRRGTRICAHKDRASGYRKNWICNSRRGIFHIITNKRKAEKKQSPFSISSNTLSYISDEQKEMNE